MPPPELVWADACVNRRKLKVPLTTSNAMDWADAFQKTLDVLSQEAQDGAWGAVTLEPPGIRVDDVEEGSESALQLVLESLVRETKAELARRRAAAEQRDRAAVIELAAQQEMDRRMTERFRRPPSR